jgi:hypothetical protein
MQPNVIATVVMLLELYVACSVSDFMVCVDDTV